MVRNTLYLVLTAGALSTLGAAQQFTYNAAALPAQNVWTDGVELADVDGDTDIDILFANGSAYGGVGAAGAQPQHLFLNNGTGTFVAAHAQLNVANFNAKMVIAEDLDNDGDLDLAYASGSTGSTARILMNNGAGVFTDETLTRFPQTVFTRSFCVVAGDVDNDGDSDLAINDGGTFGGTAAQSRLYLNNGAGFFTDATASNLPADLVNSQDITLLDFDGDFDIDYAQVGKGSGGNFGRLWVNNGTGSFSVASAMNAIGSSLTYEVDYSDVDADGDLDALVQSISGASEGVARNDGPSTPMVKLTFPGTNGGDDNEMAGIDYDNDGDLDVLVGSLATQEKLYRNDGVGVWTYQGAQIQVQGDSTLDLAVGDINGDGRYDFVTAQGESGNFLDKVYVNNGPVDSRAPTVLKKETPGSIGAGTTVFRINVQDAIQDDGKAKFYSVAYSYAVSGATPLQGSGNAFHQGAGTWRAAVPTPAGTTGVCVSWTITDKSLNTTVTAASVGTIDQYANLGSAVTGAAGNPVLSGAGAVTAGSNITFTMTNVAAGAPGLLVVGGGVLGLPICSGALIPSLPHSPTFGVIANGSGVATKVVTWPAGLPACTSVYLQAGFLDASACPGFSLTNGLRVTQP